MNIKILKLINGEEILAEVVINTNNIVEIKNAVRIVVMPSRSANDTTPTVGFAPWASFSDDKTFSLDKSHVLCIMTPIDEFITQYNNMFSAIKLAGSPSTKLVLPPSMTGPRRNG
jgi:Sm_like domain